MNNEFVWVWYIFGDDLLSTKFGSILSQTPGFWSISDLEEWKQSMFLHTMIRARVQTVSSCGFSPTWLRFSPNFGYRYIFYGITFKENHVLPNVNVIWKNQNKHVFRHIHSHVGTNRWHLVTPCEWGSNKTSVIRFENISRSNAFIHTWVQVVFLRRFSTVWMRFSQNFGYRVRIYHVATHSHVTTVTDCKHIIQSFCEHFVDVYIGLRSRASSSKIEDSTLFDCIATNKNIW